jgi:hypothetical protein
MTERSLRAISASVFGFAVLGGLWSCAALLPATFTIGVNDSPLATPILLSVLASILPCCLLAFWRRRIAGIMLLLGAFAWLLGILIQRSYMLTERHFPQPSVPRELISGIYIAAPLLAIGFFAIITKARNWPEVLGNSQTRVNES